MDGKERVEWIDLALSHAQNRVSQSDSPHTDVVPSSVAQSRGAPHGGEDDERGHRANHDAAHDHGPDGVVERHRGVAVQV